MPAISKGSCVLVTGASGYIAAHVVRQLLASGHRVRGTVRSAAKGEYLVRLFQDEGDFDYVIVEDIAAPGAFDEAVKDVDAIAHTASPFHYHAKHPKELTEPAVKGTRGVLESVQKNNPNIKRIVVTSSSAALLNVDSVKAPYNYTEADWNTDSVPHIEAKGAESTPLHMYLASKTLAERALWDFVETEKPLWDATTINPPAVLGGAIHEMTSPETASTSIQRYLPWVTGQKTEADLPGYIGPYVGMQQVAEAHVLALENPAAGGERFVVSAGTHSGQAFADVLHKRFPQIARPGPGAGVPVGRPGTHDEVARGENTVDGSKAERVLGLRYETWEETVVKLTQSLVDRGWVKM